MTIYYRIYADTADIDVSVTDAVYATARNSTAATSGGTNTTATVGQKLSGGNYTISQYFIRFDLSSIPSGTSSATLNFSVLSGTSGGFNVEAREATSLSNKIAGGSLGATGTLLGNRIVSATGSNALTIADFSGVSRTSTVNILLNSARERSNNAPTVDDSFTISTADTSGTSNDPYLDIIAGLGWDYIGVSSGVSSTANDITLVETGISGLQAGDLLIACISARSAAATDFVLPDGWNIVVQRTNNNVLTTSSAAPSGLMAYIIRGATAPALTFTRASGANIALGRIVAYRNAAQTGTLVTTNSGQQTATNTTSVNVTGLTTTNDDDLIVAMFAGGQEATVTDFRATSPSVSSSTGSTITTDPYPDTWFERIDSVTTTGADTSLAIFDGLKTSSGPTGNLLCTASIAASHIIIAAAFKLNNPNASVSVTTTSSTTSIGDETVTGTASTDVTNVSSTTNVGSVTVTTVGGDVSASVTGEVSTTSIGDETVTGTASVSLTGVSSTTSIGDETITGTASVSVTGVSSTTSVGTVIASVPISVSVTGEVSTASVGDETVTGTSTTTLTGVVSTTAVGDATVSTGTNVEASVTGVSSTTAIGDEAVTGTASISTTGVSSTTSVGDETITGTASTSVTGVSNTASLGTVIISIPISVSVTSVSSVTASGDETVIGTAVVSLTGVSSLTAVGDEANTGSSSASVTGVSSTTSVGDETITGTAVITPTGISSTTAVGTSTAAISISVNVIGLESSTSIGDETVDTNDPNVTVNLGGNSSATSVGSEVITGTAVITLTGTSSSINLNSVSVSIPISVIIVGLGLTTSVGTTSVITEDASPNVEVTVTGVSTTGQVSSATVSVPNTRIITDDFGISQVSSRHSNFKVPPVYIRPVEAVSFKLRLNCTIQSAGDTIDPVQATGNLVLKPSISAVGEFLLSESIEKSIISLVTKTFSSGTYYSTIGSSLRVLKVSLNGNAKFVSKNQKFINLLVKAEIL